MKALIGVWPVHVPQLYISFSATTFRCWPHFQPACLLIYTNILLYVYGQAEMFMWTPVTYTCHWTDQYGHIFFNFKLHNQLWTRTALIHLKGMQAHSHEISFGPFVFHWPADYKSLITDGEWYRVVHVRPHATVSLTHSTPDTNAWHYSNKYCTDMDSLSFSVFCLWKHFLEMCKENFFFLHTVYLHSHGMNLPRGTSPYTACTVPLTDKRCGWCQKSY